MDKYIKILIKDAVKANKKNEVPISSLIVDETGKVISRAYNLVETKNSAAAHAEILCIQKASKKKKNWRLVNCTLYVTLEPCVMCAEAIAKSRIKKIVYLLESKNLTEEEKIFLEKFYTKNKIAIKQYAKECEYKKILQRFFEEKRKK